MTENDDRPGNVWFFNAESFQLPRVGETTTVPLVYYNGRNRIVVGEATFKPDGQVECVFDDSLDSDIIQTFALRNYPMTFSIDRAELEDLRAPLWRGKPFSSIGDEERRSIDKILKIHIPPVKREGEADGSAH